VNVAQYVRHLTTPDDNAATPLHAQYQVENITRHFQDLIT